MNRGVLQSSPVQQMMAAGNPNWWNMINSMRPPTNSPFLPAPPPPPPLHNNSSNNLFPEYPSCFDDHDQLPESWSQLLLGRMMDEEDKSGGMVGHFENCVVNVKQEIIHPAENSSSSSRNFYGHASRDEENSQAHQAAALITNPNNPWSHQLHVMQPLPPSAAAAASLSSPKSSCVTASFSSRHLHPDRSSECNSAGSGGAVAKKARVRSSSSSTQSTFKVRKEKLGDRITSLHQLVSPFGKTDTASVLLEAIGYIRFLQSQIEALSLPYLGSGSPNMRKHIHSHSVQGERSCLFPEDPGQLLNDNCMKRKRASDHHQEAQEEPKKDLRSRGLCLVPVSCTPQVGSDNGADYWAPALGGGGGGGIGFL